MKKEKKEQYLDTRYVSAHEAMWHLLEFKQHNKSHTIIRFAGRLPFEQIMYFQEGKEADALKKAAANHTKLTGWLELNKEEERAKSFYYIDPPYHYVWDTVLHRWKKDKQSTVK